MRLVFLIVAIVLAAIAVLVAVTSIGTNPLAWFAGSFLVYLIVVALGLYPETVRRA
jgi:hypothetical protein